MYIGVDTHKATHTLVSLDEQGRQHKTFQVANTPEPTFRSRIGKFR